MSEQFKVGEIVIGRNFVDTPKRNGMEAEIIGGLENRLSRNTSTGEVRWLVCYKVRWADGDITAQTGFNLRRKQPPKREIDTVVSWDICAWRPVGVPA